jgi:hypothetical protein
MMVVFQCQAGDQESAAGIYWILRLQLTASQGGRWRSSVKLATHFRMMCESVVAG